MSLPRRRTAPSPILLVLIGVLFIVAACDLGSPGPTTTVTQPPPATAAPDTPVSSTDGAAGGTPPPVAQPDPGSPQLVHPVAGVVQVRDVAASGLVAAVNGREVAVRLEWWSGVEPCAVLAGVGVARDGNTFTLTIREGSTDPTAACIEIAVQKATVVNLGELDPGSYTITALGDVEDVSVTVE